MTTAKDMRSIILLAVLLESAADLVAHRDGMVPIGVRCVVPDVVVQEG
jgi:hypothetical protein